MGSSFFLSEYTSICPLTLTRLADGFGKGVPYRRSEFTPKLVLPLPDNRHSA